MNNKKDVIQILGCLMKDTTLLSKTDKYSLELSDFKTRLDKYIFEAIRYLYHNGANKVTTMEIQNFLETNDVAITTYKNKDGNEYLLDAEELSLIENFDYHYSRFKKINLLNDLQNDGFDISDYYDENVLSKEAIEKNKKFEFLTIEDIINGIKGKYYKIEQRYATLDSTEITNAAEDIDDIIEEAYDRNDIGLPIQGNILNEVMSGARKGTFCIRSGASGLGKALPNSLEIPTVDGFKKIGEIKVGDLLFDRWGNFTEVIAVFPQGEKQAYEVTLEDGRKTICCNEHLWAYTTEKNGFGYVCGDFKVDELKVLIQLLKDDVKVYLPNKYEEGMQNFYTEIVSIKALDYEEEMTCFTVDNNEHLFLINDYIVTHNTRNMVADACYLAYPLRYNDATCKWEDIGSDEKVLYVVTEQSTKEIKRLIISYLTGINGKRLRYGNFNERERKLLNQAKEIMKRYADNFIIVKMQNPMIELIKNTIRETVIMKNTEYVFYDYIMITPSLLKEFKGFNLRNDELLLMMSEALKNLAAELDIFVMSATQVSAKADESKEIRNESSLAGGRATINKADYGFIMARPTKEELDILKEYIEETGITPNLVIDVFKVRDSDINQVRIWSLADLGIMRREDLFITDSRLETPQEYKTNFNLSYQKWDRDGYEELTNFIKELNTFD